MTNAHIPYLIIYWADTKQPLSHLEFAALELNGNVLSIRPSEILLEERDTKRKVIITAAYAPGTPAVPAPKT